MTDNTPATVNPVVFFDLTLGGAFACYQKKIILSRDQNQFYVFSFLLKSQKPLLSLSQNVPQNTIISHTQYISYFPTLSITHLAISKKPSQQFKHTKSNIPPLPSPPHHAGEPLGRIKIELFAETTPKTAENFRQYCTGETKNAQGYPQGYKGSKFHRVVRQPLIFFAPRPLLSSPPFFFLERQRTGEDALILIICSGKGGAFCCWRERG